MTFAKIPRQAILFAMLLLCAPASSHAQTSEALSSPLSFENALRKMVSGDLNVKTQETKLQIAREKLFAGQAAFLPTISTGYSKEPWGGMPRQSYSITAGLNLFHWGADWSNLKSSELDVLAQNDSLTQTQLNAETDDCEALFDLIEDAQELATYKRSEKNARMYHQIAVERYNRSFLSAEDLDKVTLDLSNAEALRAQAETSLAHSLSIVESKLGQRNVNTDDWPWQNRILKLDVNQFERIQANDALELRPDYESAKELWQEETWRTRSALASVLPRIDFNYSQSKSQTGNQSFTGWDATFSVSIPLFNAFQDEAAYKVEVQTKAAAEYQMRQLERNIRSEQNEAKTRYRIAIDQYKNRLQDLSLAERLFNADTKRFRMGRATADDISLDLERVTRSQRLTIESVHHADSAYVALLHAYGKSVLN